MIENNAPITESTETENEDLVRASKIARAEICPDPEREYENRAWEFVAAKKNVSCSGNIRELYYRMRRSPGNDTWEYYAEEMLPKGNYRASDRCATVYGKLYVGDIVAQHDRGRPIDQVYLVYYNSEEKKAKLYPCNFFTIRGGLLAIELPDGASIKLPNPRKN